MSATSGKGNLFSNKILDLLLSAQTFTPPPILYIALYTTTPSAGGGGTEVSGGGDARVALTANLTNFPAAAGQLKTNGVAIDFGTASANWGSVVAATAMDASSGGNIVEWGPLAVARTVNNGDPFKINAGNAIFTES
jgi:hypothetical protein